jgi:hypothetical protein
MQYQAVIQLSQSAPQIYDLPQLHRQMIEVLGIRNAEKLIPIDDDMKPRDPVSENMAFLTGKPTKAFIYQDHDAHIAVHTSMMQDPAIMAQIGQNPMAQQMQAAIMAHVAEHVAFQYRSQLEQRLGVTLPAPDTEMPEQVEVQLSKLVAQASQQLLQIHKGEAAQKQAEQQAQDPIVQMQQAELQIKQQEAQTKAQKVQGDLAIRQAEVQIKAQEAASRQGENPELAAAKMQQEMIMDRQMHEQEMAQRQREFDQKMAQKQQEASIKMRTKLMEIANKPVAKSPEN